MRKRQKEQLQELLVTLSEAHDEVKRALKQSDFFLAQDVLAACQECAIEIGNAIEEAEGEDAPSVLCIQKYCECLFTIYSQIENSVESMSCGDVSNVLHDHLAAIVNSVDEIPAKIEVVFLPYKASMWDSLESVWRAAEADENCDAYVVPIPYFDKNADGSLGQMHDESCEYGTEIPMVSWKEYDIASRQPDMIFIHNPYDNGNRVTSVHPAFYSKELVKYTNQLIYIPYFVAGESVAEHFCVLPGTVFAHKVILESEKIRDTYIRVFGKWAKETGYDKINPNWEDKFLALGSPKYDKVSETNRDNCDLPTEWRDKLYDTDGRRKKAVFYNTSVTALLKHPNMLEKIRYTLKVFKENPDVVLWWRPHPLYESTLESMRPEMLAEYRAIVTAYKEEGWGIFDDTADMNRAIAQTDAYYGDPGSVVALYQKTGKPVMVQNADVLGEVTEETVKDIPIWPSDFCVDGDDIWFMHGKINILMKYNMAEKTTTIIGSVPNERIFQESLYANIHKYGDKIYLIPCWGREIAIYHILEKRFQKVALENIERYENRLLFCKAFAYGKYLYCVPYYYHAILKIDMEKGEITHNVDCVGVGQDELGGGSIYVHDASQVGKRGFIGIFTHTNVFFFYDVENEKISIKKLEYSNARCVSIACVEGRAIFYDANSKCLLEYTMDTDVVRRSELDSFASTMLEKVNENVFLIDSVNTDAFVVVDENDHIVYREVGEPVYERDTLSYQYCIGRCKDRGFGGCDFFYFNTACNSMYHISDNTVVNRITIKLEYDTFLNIKKCLGDISTYASSNENRVFSLLDFLMKSDRGVCLNRKGIGKVGLKIFSEMRV